MKLKYYLRGMGIGIILTAIVMGFALGGRKATISDAEIIQRAKVLGMVEASEGTLTQTSAPASKDSKNKDDNEDKPLGGLGEEIALTPPATATETQQIIDTKELDEISDIDENSNAQSQSSIKETSDAKTENTPQVNEASGTQKTETAAATAKTTKTPAATAKTTQAPASTAKTAETAASTSKTTQADSSTKATTAASNTSAAASNASTAATKATTAASNASSAASVSADAAIDDDDTSDFAHAGDDETATASNEEASTNSASATTTTKSDSASKAASKAPSGKTVEIPGGTSSDGVAFVLYKAGVIDNASDFNKYLVDNGVDRRLRSGTKVIPEGATYDQIAAIITKP